MDAFDVLLLRFYLWLVQDLALHDALKSFDLMRQLQHDVFESISVRTVRLIKLGRWPSPVRRTGGGSLAYRGVTGNARVGGNPSDVGRLRAVGTRKLKGLLGLVLAHLVLFDSDVRIAGVPLCGA